MATTENVSQTTIKKLEQIKGVGPEILKKLRKSGFKTVEDVAISSNDELCKKVGISSKTAKEIITIARDLLEKSQYPLRWDKTLPVAFKKQTDQLPLSTGVNGLDDILGNGLEAGTITEVYGASGTGKTQLSHQLCVMVQLPVEHGGIDGNAMYIDTQKTFRPKRILNIAQKYENVLEIDNVLHRIYQVDAINSEHLTSLLSEARTFIRETNTKLLIIDSFISHYIGELYKASEHKLRQQKLNHDLYLMAQLIFRFPQLIIIFTNQVERQYDTYFGDPNQPLGDNAPSHASTIQICLKKLRANLRIARIIHSPNLPESETVFRITDSGICDEDFGLINDESSDSQTEGWFERLLTEQKEK